MKTRTLFGSILITLLCTIAFVSCSKDDDAGDGKGQNDRHNIEAHLSLDRMDIFKINTVSQIQQQKQQDR